MNQLKAGAFLNYVSIALHMVVGIVYTPFMLRMLGQSEYGLYSLAASIIAYLTVLDLGFGNAIVRYTAKFRSEGKEQEQQYMFGMFLLLYMGIGLIAFLIGIFLSLNVQSIFSSNMTPEEVYRTQIMLWLMTFNLAFTFPMSLWGSIMTAYERFVFQRIVSIIRGVLNPIVMVALLVVGYKAVAMVVITTFFNVVTLLINWWYCKYRLFIKIRFEQFKWSFLKEVCIYSFWIFLNAITERIYWSTGQFILGIYKGTIAVAIYSVAIQLKDMFYMFSTAISGVLLPRVTSMISKGATDKEMSDLFIRTGRIQYIIMALILTGFILFGKKFIELWAGTEYSQAYYICLLFFITTCIPLIQNLGIIILLAKNQLKFRSIWILSASAVSLIIAVPCCSYFGVMGCAWITAIAIFIAYGVGLNIYYWKKINIDILGFWKEIGKMSIIPSLFATGGSFLLSYCHIDSILTLILGIACFLVVYTPSFYFFSMNHSEQNLLIAPIKSVCKKLNHH